MGYAVWIAKDGIKVIDAMEVVGKENADVMFSVVRGSIDSSVPIADGVLDVQLFSELVAASSSLDVNEFVKKSFASTLGALAALAALPLGPTLALAADQGFSIAFEEAYENVNEWSRGLNWVPVFDLLDSTISPQVNTTFRTSQFSASPIVLDLDGDGVEIAPLTGSITFDHNADGIRTGTAWAKADDGLLVLDRDGNGLIDTGRELFGNNTLLSNGQKAADGYAAMRGLDTNADGQLDANDSRFADLRVWRDLDQDGHSDAGELFSLQDTGISRIGLTKTASTQTLADGTRLDGVGSFTLNGQSRGYTDAWFAENPFYREFSTPIELSDAVAALPQMKGLGMVRDLREAISLGTAEARALRGRVQAFAADISKSDQTAQINSDSVIIYSDCVNFDLHYGGVCG